MWYCNHLVIHISILIKPMNRRNLYPYIKISGLLLFPVLLFFIPVDWLDRQHSICLFKNLTGHECYGCGITRAIVSTIQFHFESAFHYNKLIIIVFPLLVFVWIKTVYKYFKGLHGTLLFDKSITLIK